MNPREPTMQNDQTKPAPDTAGTDPGFKLPGQTAATPHDSLPKTTPDTATQPVEIAPGGATNTSAAPLRDTAGRDMAIGAVALVVRAGRDWAVREIPLGDIAKAVVQVEFSPPNQAELELASMGQARRTETGA